MVSVLVLSATMNILIGTHLIFLLLQVICALPKESKVGRKGHVNRYIAKMSQQAEGAKREIKIGFLVCGKDDTSITDTQSNHMTSPNPIELEESHRGIRKHSTKRGWGKNWLKKLHGCCRSHDACPRVVAPKSENFGYFNVLDYKVYDCECDDAFSDCLKLANSFAADAVGDLYFNILKIPCMSFSNGNKDLDKEHTDIAVVKTEGHSPGNGSVKVRNSNVLLHLLPGDKVRPDIKEVTLRPVERHAKPFSRSNIK